MADKIGIIFLIYADDNWMKDEKKNTPKTHC